MMLPVLGPGKARYKGVTFLKKYSLTNVLSALLISSSLPTTTEKGLRLSSEIAAQLLRIRYSFLVLAEPLSCWGGEKDRTNAAVENR